MDIDMDTMIHLLNGMAGIDSTLIDKVLRFLSGVQAIWHVEVSVLCGSMALTLSQTMALLLVKFMVPSMASAVTTDPTRFKLKLVLEIIMSTNW